MAEVSNNLVIGDISVRPTGYSTDEQLYTLKRYDHALGNANHDRMHYAPASFFVIDLYVLTTAAAGETKQSGRMKAPFPFTIWAADVCCETSGGSASTVDIYSDDASTDASLLDAPESVHATLTSAVRVALEDGSEDIAYGTEVYIRQASVGGNLVGGQAHLYCQRK